MPRTSALEVVLRPLEALLEATASTRLRAPPTFVIGPPRGGTTVVGLHLFNTFDFAYFPNVAKRNPKTAYLRARLARRKGEWIASYDNAYGTVQGDLALSDGWDILQRWFEPYREATRADAEHARGLIKLVARFEELYGAPFYCKNNANSTRIAALDALFPNALFVHVTRALPEAVASLLEARKRHRVQLNSWWSAAPPQFLERRFSDETEQAIATVWGVDRYIERELGRLARERWTRVEYESFCERPDEVVDWMRSSYAERGVALRARPGSRPERFEASRLESARRAELERAIQRTLPTLGANSPYLAPAR